MGDLLALFSSSGLGALFGLVGGAVKQWQETKQKKLDNAHAEKMRVADLKELELEHAQQVLMVDKEIDLAEAEGAISLDQGEISAFVESQKGGDKFMDIAKSLMRPVITLYVLVFSTVIFVQVHVKIGGVEALPATEMVELYRYIIYQVIFLTVMAVSWWFAARPSSMRRMSRAERVGQ